MTSLPDTGLPIEAVVGDVRTALSERGSAVLVAPPGSGKTTVVPLRLMDEAWIRGGKIVVLEPRRLATRAAARRMAHLLGEEIGGTVGYVTRTDRRTGPTVRVEVVTEGVLTRRLQRDPELSDTAAVVFDELHERNLQTDLGLALAIEARRVFRPDLRILAMSATIDAARVAELIGGTSAPIPVIEADARAHPIDLRWVPPPRRGRLEDHVAHVVRRAVSEEPGDVLVFLPGMGEITRVASRLREPPLLAAIHMLHGSLPVADQDAALAPSLPGMPKVVLSTDIAESSLTVEGVRVVIDSGLARAPRFDARTGMTRLRTISISKASADQRAGRAGRSEPGVAYRLWSKIEHGTRRPHLDPEITQVDLAGLALELALWGTEDPAELAFLDQPPARSLEEGRTLLQLLGAIDDAGRITDLGRGMARLPLHPRLAHMVLASGDDGPTAAALAALIDDRDVLRGDSVPVDVGVRLRLMAGGEPSASADGRTVDRVRRAASDLADRAGVPAGAIAPDHAGRILALAFPDRLAVRRGSPGRFQLRTGTTAWLPASDPLATEQFLVVADLDGKRKDARIRLAAPLDGEEVAAAFAHEVEIGTRLVWVGDRLVERTEHTLGGMVLDAADVRPKSGAAVTAALLEHIRRHHVDALPWTDEARRLIDRVAYLREARGDSWPDWSIETLMVGLDEWLAPALSSCSGLDDVGRLDLVRILRSHLPGSAAAELDRLAPVHLAIPTGRRVPVDYSSGQAVVRVRVQEVFGLEATPEVDGRPVVLHLLSPADRPLQITSDLAGFWAGSWQQVRKEMTGRYPKHEWPEDPSQVRPHRR